jgi:hypothetical protein
MFAFLPFAAAAADVPVEFFVSVPKETDFKATLYIAGSLEALGSWQGQGVALKRLDDPTEPSSNTRLRSARGTASKRRAMAMRLRIVN